MTVIKDHVREAFSNARDNGCTFDGWTDEEIATDMTTYDADIEPYPLADVIAAIRDVRKEAR